MEARVWWWRGGEETERRAGGLRMEGGRRRGPRRGLKAPDLGVESNRAESGGSALSDPAPSYWATMRYWATWATRRMVPIARRVVPPRRGWARGVG